MQKAGGVSLINPRNTSRYTENLSETARSMPFIAGFQF